MGEQRYTAQKVIDAMRDSFGIKTVVAQRLGCVRGTVDNYIARYPTVAQAFREERGKFVDLAQSRLVKRVQNDDDWAIKFVLSTLGKDEGFTEKVEQDSNVVIRVLYGDDGDDS